MEEPKLLEPESASKEEENNSVVLALTNDVILEHICSFLPVVDLKNCRLVNHQWNQESTKIADRKCTKIIVWDRGARYQMSEILRLTQLISTSWKFPCTKFWLRSGITLSNRPLLGPELADFLQAIGPIATELTVYGANGDDSQYFRGELPNEISFPRLKTLNLSCFGGGDTDNLTEFTSRLINVASSLQELILKLVPFTSESINMVLNAIENPLGRRIQRLELSAELKTQHLERLQGLNLKLKFLDLQLRRNSIVNPLVLKSFLESQRGTLENLAIYLCDGITVRFPRMERLHHLDLKGEWDEEREQRLRFPEFSLSQHFPTLKHLSLADCKGSKECAEFFRSNTKPLSSLESLKLPDSLTDPTVIPLAARVFPNLRKLQIPARGILMEAVFNSMSGQVKELTLMVVSRNGADLEGALTGYSQIELEQIKGLSGKPKQLVETYTKPPAFLLGLRILKVVDCRVDIWNPTSGITDLTCRLALLKLTSLKCLDLLKSSCRITEDTLEEMRSRFVVLCQDSSIQR